jgi:preprotein translocase subunit SecF
MHLFIALSCVLVAIGIAVGVVCQFVAGGYFNYGAEYKSYNSVVVSYVYIDYTDESEVTKLCDDVFTSNGIKPYSTVSGDNDQGREIVYSFSKSVDAEKIKTSATEINAQISKATQLSDVGLSSAYFHTDDTKLGGGYSLMYGAIALATVIVFQMLYFIIRYKLAMALSVLLADVHNLAIYVSLLTITRVPVGSSAFTFGVLAVIVTMIGCSMLFDRVRRNMRKEKYEKLSAGELVDLSANESFLNATVFAVALAVAAVAMFVFMSISALSVVNVLTYAVCALCAAASCVYGTSFFTPAVYARFKKIGDDYKAKHLKRPAKI